MPLRLVQSDVFFFPYLYRNPVTGKMKGIYYDMFTAWLPYSNETRIELVSNPNHDEVPNESGVYEGVVGTVVNGTADATIDDFGYTPDKVKMHRYTVPQVNFGQSSFYEKEQVINDWTLASFVVFPVKIIAIILALIILVRAVEFARHMVQAKLNIPYKDEHKLTSSLALLGSFMLYLMYSSAFAGNASSAMTIPANTLQSMTNQLQSGEATMVLSDGFFSPDTIMELFGRPQEEINNFHIVSDLQQLTEMLCASSPQNNIYTYSLLYNIFSSNSTRSAIKCQLQTVNSKDMEYINNNLKSFAGLTLETPYPVTFYFNKKRFTNRQVKAYNKIVNKLYGLEKMDGLWWRRYTGKAKQTFSVRPASPAASFMPLPISAYNAIFVIAGVLLAISIPVLIAEILWKSKYVDPLTYDRLFNV
ncbi:hypothetical protein PRIPAC_96867 [Pristionchus pacificus]|uniref:Uncharacterized protein n=1 Tax=Pristionchus pacificus TaxID=54126 RepID=A0A2A6B2K8_PRIPA|nr:hypothetical protein PRIPAC_96867 [Pristionchus pacificus]|eukprot:PDM60108.1 hypothetical protein PRIPAC_49394 [Pristionchus pacificus]